MIEATAIIQQSISASAGFTAALSANIIIANTGSCPIITEIDGGTSDSNSQFSAINGLLDGGGS
jgi:hypothetical protein